MSLSMANHAKQPADKGKGENALHGDTHRADGRRAWDVIFLSFRHVWTQLALWVRLNLWTVLLCIPIITAPAAIAALTATTRAGLLDEHQNALQPRVAYRQAFFDYFGIALALTIVNILIGAASLGAFAFWLTLEPWYAKLPAIVAGFFLVLWWISQPILWAILVESASPSIVSVLRATVRLVLSRAIETFYVSIIHTLLWVAGIVLIGPVLLVLPALLAVMSVQTCWLFLGRHIPAWDTPAPDERT